MIPLIGITKVAWLFKYLHQQHLCIKDQEQFFNPILPEKWP